MARDCEEKVSEQILCLYGKKKTIQFSSLEGFAESERCIHERGAANLRSPGSSGPYGRYIPAHVIQAQVIYTNKKVN